MSRQLTIRGVPDDVAESLERLSRARGTSVNATVKELLAEAVATDARRRRLERAATWTEGDLEEFDAALASQRTIDHALWG
jgi:plasmid stability protein